MLSHAESIHQATPSHGSTLRASIGAQRVRPIEISVVVPTYNEAGNLVRVIAGIASALAGVSWEAIVVDPAGWAFAFLAILGAMVFVLLPARNLGAVWVTAPLSPNLGRRPLMAMFLLLYAVFMAVHLYLGTKRVLYLYHYFPALLLAFCLVPLLEEAAERSPVFRRRQHAVLGGAVALSLLAFLFYSPFTFHRPLTHAECERRAWLAEMVSCRD